MKKARGFSREPQSESMLTAENFRWRDGTKLVWPKEHGSWFLALEPVALGMLAAPSAAGAALAVAASSGFLLRRPLKIISREQNDKRWKMALAAFLVLTFIAALGLSLAAKIGGVKNLWPLLPAVLAGSVFAWCDRRNEAREGAVEVAGAVTFSLLPAAFATLADWSAPAALALAAMMLTRSVPTVLTVRANLRIKKGQAVSTFPALFAAATGLILTMWLIWLRLAPWPAIIFAAAFMARTIWLLAWRPRLKPGTIGIIEATMGGLMILTLAATWKHF